MRNPGGISRAVAAAQRRGSQHHGDGGTDGGVARGHGGGHGEMPGDFGAV